MPNMSYCRFQNTLLDVQDCLDEMEQFDSPEEFLASLSDEERQAAKVLFQIFGENAELADLS